MIITIPFNGESMMILMVMCHYVYNCDNSKKSNNNNSSNNDNRLFPSDFLD